MGDVELDVGSAGPAHRRQGLGQPGHTRSHHAKQAGGFGIADQYPQFRPRAQGLQIGPAQRLHVAAGHGEAQRGPGPLHIVQRNADVRGHIGQTVFRRPGPLQDITGQPEQPAA